MSMETQCVGGIRLFAALFIDAKALNSVQNEEISVSPTGSLLTNVGTF